MCMKANREFEEALEQQRQGVDLAEGEEKGVEEQQDAMRTRETRRHYS